MERSGPEPPSRVESARGRAAAARRGFAWAAVASFGVALVLVRASHPATLHGSSSSTPSSSLTAPSSLVAEVQGSTLGGGSIAAASAPPAASTSTS